MKNLNTEELEAATFRRLLNHLSNRTDVQNLDLMNLAGFSEIVYLDGTVKKQKKKVFKSIKIKLKN